MQEPAGYLMNFVGGDYYVHADNNRWTDNAADGKDDRLINVQPCDPVAQWVFVQAESILAVRLRESRPHLRPDLPASRFTLRRLDLGVTA